MTAPTGAPGRTTWWLAAIAVLAAALNAWHLDFPLGFHADEPVKVESILTGTNNFYHPLLMLQLVRAANGIAGVVEPQAVVLLGRGIMALCGVGTVLLAFALARRLMAPGFALGVALAVAVSPTMVVHAHYLKEDTVLVMSLMAASLCYLRWVEQPGRARAILLAITTGMALSSHYKATLLVPLVLAAPLLGSVGRVGEYYRRLLAIGIGAAAVFLVINWPLFLDPRGFVAGALSEATHAVVGEDALIRWNDYLLGFHATWSLAPGMGWPALLLGTAGLGLTLAGWRRASFQARWMVAFVVVFYLVHEVSPLKPWPDYSRYVLPAVPMLLCLAGMAAWTLWTRWTAPGARMVMAGLVLVAGIGFPAYRTVRLVDGIGHDTRTRAAQWLRANPGTVVADRYAIDQSGDPVGSVAPLDPGDLAAALDPVALVGQGVTYVAVSSFVYQRFAVGAALDDQAPAVHAAHRRFEELFALPYTEFAPDYRSFAFSNPVVRIVDLRRAATTTR